MKVAHIFHLHLKAAEAGSTHFQVQSTTGRKHAVAHRFSLKAPRGKTPKQPAGRIDGNRLFVWAAILLPGARKEDGPVQVFDGPAIGHELGGQPVEQLRVGGWHAVVSEVAGGIHDAGTKMELPDSVGHYTRSQWVFRVSDPVGQRKPTLLLRCVALEFQRDKGADGTGPHLLAFGIGFTAIKPVCGAGLGKGASISFGGTF